LRRGECGPGQREAEPGGAEPMHEISPRDGAIHAQPAIVGIHFCLIL
jgi:hypothetical protein